MAKIDYDNLTKQIVEYVGGVENIKTITHCVTRLRLYSVSYTHLSEKTKDIVDQWVTGKHILDIDKDIKSQLEKNGKAEGCLLYTSRCV